MSSLMTKIINKIERKAQKDKSYLEKLKKSPKQVFEEVSNIKLPDTIKVQLETISNPAEMTITLPPSPKMLKQFDKSENKLIDLYKSMFFYVRNEKEVKEKLRDVEIQQLVASKAWKEKEFMQKLNDSPKEAVQSLLNEKLDPEVQVKVFKNNLNILHLPVRLLPASGEISDTELKHVAGGFVEKIGLFLVEGAVSSPVWRDIGRDLE